MAHVPRQSVAFNPNASAQQLQAIHASISGVQEACSTLAETNAVLAYHTDNLDRLSTVMANHRHFDLASERDVRQARDRVAAEVAPLLRELIVRAEEALTNDERHARTLRNKATQGLAELEGGTEHRSDMISSPSVASLVSGAELEEQEKKLEKLRLQRERLMAQVAELEEKRAM
ncbi:DASH complex subunit spc19 [Malassezia vespertilionis]|uniref:DASH complex subunit SPC19 n=1 Tax=Malassezia vespertilionis TaxID=2020962 RepID=A0A2N1JBZ9_9BASI|nr:DASH complex subunit spc19 [Malassezia vespertilionis]PKI84063.1 hypothetical protein MVES_002119 [Malassezia vespertilionis]WFD06890.1 DASH complex subunit spc19 [Malassezia vespertilionis]